MRTGTLFLVFLIGIWGFVLFIVYSLMNSLYLRRNYARVIEQLAKRNDQVVNEMKKLSTLITTVENEDTISQLKGILNDMAMHLDVDHEYSYFRIIYEIGERPEDDAWSRKFEVVATDEDIVVLKRILFGASGPGFSHVRCFEDLSVEMDTSQGSIEILNIEPEVDEENQIMLWRGNIMFTEPILPGKSREVTISGKWPHLWDNLRLDGEDRDCSFTLEKRCKTLEIILVFPKGVKQAELIRVSPPNAGVIETTKDTRLRLQKIWRIEKAEPTTYSYMVKCEELKLENPGSAFDS